MQKHDPEILTGSLWRGVLRFALPLAATGLLQQLFNAADIAVVGRIGAEEGKIAMAAVGSNSPVINLVVNLFVGVSLGANVVLANRAGRGDREGVSRGGHTAVLLSLVCGTAAAVLCECAAAPLLRAMGVPADVYSDALRYLRIYLLGLPVILLTNFEAAIFRSQGDTRTPFFCLVGAGALNVALNLFFVFVLGMTVEGVAIATALSNLACSLVLFFLLGRGREETRIYLRRLTFHGDSLRNILIVGLPAGIQSMLFSAANIFIQTAINSLDTTVMAASAAAFNLEILAYYFYSAFGQACATFVGQNHGAGNLDRCRKTLAVCLAEGLLACAAGSAVLLLGGRGMLRFFNEDPEVVAYGYIRLFYISIAYLFSVQADVYSGYLRGFGMSFIPAAISVAGVCGVRLAWIYLAFYPAPSFARLMLAYPISMSISAGAILTACLLVRPSRRLAEKERPPEPIR